jgi:hypothetical protein
MVSPFLTSSLDGGEWSASRPGRFTSKEITPGCHWIGGWMGPRASPDCVEKTKSYTAVNIIHNLCDLNPSTTVSKFHRLNITLYGCEIWSPDL